jgi:hypothetical protein
MSFPYCLLQDVKDRLLGLDISDMPANLESIIEDSFIPWATRQIDVFVGENLSNTTVSEFYDGTGRNFIILRHRPVSFVRRVVLRIIPSLTWFTFKRWFHLNETDITGITAATRGGVTPINSTVDTPYTFINTDPVPVDLQTTNPLLVTGQFINTSDQYGASDLFVDCSKGILTIPPRILYLENQAIPFWNYTWLRGFQNIEVDYDYGYKDLEHLPLEIRNACAYFVAANVLMAKGHFYGAGSANLSMTGMNLSFRDVPFGSHIKMYLEIAKQNLVPYKRLHV